VYSTDQNFTFQYGGAEEQETISKDKQQLRVFLDTSGRAGKQVTLIKGFVGALQDLESLSKKLKAYCGTGGSVKDGEILIQGDQREKAKAFLLKEGYRCR